jgi:hypothetical protein
VNETPEKGSSPSDRPPGSDSWSLFGYLAPLGLEPSRKYIDSPWMPSIDQLEELWRLFKSRINPFVPVLHKPSIEKCVVRVRAEGFEIFDRCDTALVLAICSASIAGLDEIQCAELFNEKRDQLNRKSKRAFDLALKHAQWLQNHDIRIVQAVAIVLVSLLLWQ